MKKLLLFFLLIFSFTFCKVNPTYAQTNLVPNPSFEQYSSCPNAKCGISLAAGWYSAGYTPDYFNSCASWPFGVPQNAAGYQYPASGNAYALVGTYGGGREYIAIRLATPLETGIKYFVNFMASPIDRFAYCGNNKMGVLLSTVSYSLSNDSCNSIPGVLPNNFAHVYSNQIIMDSSNWTSVSGSFIADSAYQYIIIGNHFDDINTDTVCFGSNIGGAAYFVDDIYVSTDSLTTLTEKQLDNYSFAIYPNPFNSFTSVFLSSNFNIKERWEIQLYDVYGNEIKHITVPNGEKKVMINRDNLPVGIYFAKISIGNKIITKKIIITK